MEPEGGALTVNVAPEGLGPVTLRAQITSTGLQIEVFAPNDAGRDALRAVLTDLRRDATLLGQVAVQLGAGDPPSSGGSSNASGHQQAGAQNAAAQQSSTQQEDAQGGAERGRTRRDDHGLGDGPPAPDSTDPAETVPAAYSIHLDVLA